MGTSRGCRSRGLVVLGAVTVLRARLLPNAARCAADRCGKTNRGVRFRCAIVATHVHRMRPSFRSWVRTKQLSPSSCHVTAVSSDRRRAVVRAVRTLPEREQRLIELRFGFDGEPRSLATVGRELGITRQRARQLEREALAKLERVFAINVLGEIDRASPELPRAA
jgi:DNA-directed RNA polymerase specialized sigma24 family protein